MMENQPSSDVVAFTNTDNQLTINSNFTQPSEENENVTNGRKSCKSAQSIRRRPLPVRQQMLSLSAHSLGRLHRTHSRSVSPLAPFRYDSQLASLSNNSTQLNGAHPNQSLTSSDHTESPNQLRKSCSFKLIQPDFSTSSSLNQKLSPYQLQESSNGVFRQQPRSATTQDCHHLHSTSKLPTHLPPLSQNTQPSDQNTSSAVQIKTPALPPPTRNDSLSSLREGDNNRRVFFSHVDSVKSFSTMEVRESKNDYRGSNIDDHGSESDDCGSKDVKQRQVVMLLSESLTSEQSQSFSDVVEVVSHERERSKDKQALVKKFSTSSLKRLSDNGSCDGSKQTTDYLVMEIQKRFTRRVSRRISRASLVSLTSTVGQSSNQTIIPRHKITKEELREKWLNATRVVRSIVRLSLWLKDYSRSREEPQTIEQLNYYSMRTEFASEKLVFDKGYYASSNVIYTPPWARLMMSLEPEARSPNDIQHLASILKSMNLFKNEVPPEKVYDLCKHCRYSRYEKQRLLVRNGHRSMFTYLILSGSVFVNIEEKNIDSGRKYYRTALILEQGNIFGEIAVIHDVPRTASIVVREDVELLVIDKDTCLRIFPEIMKRDYELRLEKMRATDLFRDWPEESLHALCVVSKQLEYPYGAVIDKNTRESEFIYVVTKAAAKCNETNTSQINLVFPENQGRVEVMCYISLTSFTTPTTHEDKVIQKLIRNPPNHTYLPPMPVLAPPLLCRKSLDKAATDGKVLVSVDSLTPYDICDLVSLNKHSQPMTLILVSRGSEVIRIPKLRLHTIPPIRCWKAIVQRAKDTPRYPPKSILSRIFVEHAQWKSCKGIVLRDVLSYTTDCRPVIQDRTAGRRQGEKTSPAVTVQVEGEEWDVRSEGSDNVFTAPSYKKCLSLDAPLHDIKHHTHGGPCLRSWRRPKMETRRTIAPHYKKRALSMTSYS